jgi:membrane protein required for colicin V production
MTAFDYLVILILLCSIAISAFRGLVREILSLVSWAVAFFVANAYGETLSMLLPEVIPGGLTRLIGAFVVLFIGARLLMALVMMAVEAGIRAAGLTVMDRGLGGLFGLGRGLLIVMTFVLLCGLTAIPSQPFWTQALLSPLAETAAITIKPYLPGEFARRIQF